MSTRKQDTQKGVQVIKIEADSKKGYLSIDHLEIHAFSSK